MGMYMRIDGMIAVITKIHRERKGVCVCVHLQMGLYG
jgi:hypothetical protein